MVSTVFTENANAALYHLKCILLSLITIDTTIKQLTYLSQNGQELQCHTLVIDNKVNKVCL